MGRKLLIAEKYKVAVPFAKFLGANGRANAEFKGKGNIGWLEGGDWVVTWCFGHLIETCRPDEYDPAYKRWTLDNLPILPEDWKVKPTSSEPGHSQFAAIKRLLASERFDVIYHAADADREGELIVRELLDYLGVSGTPVRRLWYTDTTEASMRRALDEAKPLSEYDDLGRAALLRQRADWLYGMNLSRAYTSFAGETRNVGRVVSPTLNLVVEREREIEGFVPQDYLTVTAHLQDGDREFDASARYDDVEHGRAVAKAIRGKVGTITSVESKEVTERRKLYDLTSLQADAAAIFGYDADRTARIAQRLYENGWQTYPRTSSNWINPDQVAEVEPLLPQTASMVFGKSRELDVSRLDVSRLVQERGKGAEASHTGLCPTSQGLSAYQGQIRPDAELRNVFVLVCCRMLSAALPPRVSAKTAVGVDIDGEAFAANGSVDIDPGFLPFEKSILAALGKKVKQTREAVLPDMAIGDRFDVTGAKTKKSSTKPPKRYTVATLLTQMKEIASLLPEKEMRDVLRAHGAGLGTVSSRDGVLKTLQRGEFVVSKGGYLHPTDKARSLMEILPDHIKSPVMTANMEMALDGVASGAQDDAEVYDRVVDEVRRDVDEVKRMPGRAPEARRRPRGKRFSGCVCPMCGSPLVETDKAVSCEECDFIMWRTVAKKRVPLTELKSLAKDGMSTQRLEGFKSRKGTDFGCWLYLDEKGKVSFDFDRDGREAKSNFVLRSRRGGRK